MDRRGVRYLMLSTDAGLLLQVSRKGWRCCASCAHNPSTYPFRLGNFGGKAELPDIPPVSMWKPWLAAGSEGRGIRACSTDKARDRAPQ